MKNYFVRYVNYHDIFTKCQKRDHHQLCKIQVSCCLGVTDFLCSEIGKRTFPKSFYSCHLKLTHVKTLLLIHTVSDRW